MSEFDYNRDKLSNWLDKNIISIGHELFHSLEKAGLVSYEDIENLYEYNVEDDVNKMKEIFTWYIITEEAYNKFKKIDLCVVKINELYLFGRTICGQPIIGDFNYMKDEINIILNQYYFKFINLL